MLCVQIMSGTQQGTRLAKTTFTTLAPACKNVLASGTQSEECRRASKCFWTLLLAPYVQRSAPLIIAMLVIINDKNNINKNINIERSAPLIIAMLVIIIETIFYLSLNDENPL